MLAWRRIAQALIITASLVVGATAYRLSHLLLTNRYVPGSLAWSSPLAVLLALLGAAAVAVPFCAGAYRLRPPHILAALLILVGSVIAFPVACDTRESFLDSRNRRCTCVGLTVHWFPRGVFDSSDVEYCIGMEGASS